MERENPLKNAELSTEQNYNAIDGIVNNLPLLPPVPEEKPLERVINPPPRRRSREREDR